MLAHHDQITGLFLLLFDNLLKGKPIQHDGACTPIVKAGRIRQFCSVPVSLVVFSSSLVATIWRF